MGSAGQNEGNCCCEGKDCFTGRLIQKECYQLIFVSNIGVICRIFNVLQIALRWLLQKDGVSSVIIGCKTMEQLEDNLGASAGWQLTDTEMNVLDNMSQKPIPYPYAMINRLQKSSVLCKQKRNHV